MRPVLVVAAFLVASAELHALVSTTWDEIQEIRRQKEQEKQAQLARLQREMEAQRAVQDGYMDERHPYRVDESILEVREPRSREDLKRMMVEPRDEKAGEPLPGVPLIFGTEIGEGDQTPGAPRLPYRRWSLLKDDLVPLPPVEDFVRLNFGPDLRYFLIPYRVSNSTDGRVVLVPRFWLLTDSGRIDVETGGFLVKRDVSASMLRDVYTTQELLASLAEKGTDVTPIAALEPGQARWGVAIFPQLDPEMDFMKVVVEGLSNDYNFTKMLRPVLVLAYERRGDEFFPQFDLLEYKGKEWQQQWMWWMEMAVSRPAKADITGPAGDETKRQVWVFDLTLKNSTEAEQTIAIETVRLLLRDVPVRLHEADEPVNVVVRIEDDGESTIYKAAALKETAHDFKARRFISGQVNRDSEVSMTVAVDLEDIDWDDIHEQVWLARRPSAAALYAGAFTGTLEPSEGRAVDEFLRRGITEEHKRSMREQVLQHLPAAFDAMMQSRLMRLEVTGDAGIATGTFELLRDFTVRTPLDERLRVTWPE